MQIIFEQICKNNFTHATMTSLNSTDTEQRFYISFKKFEGKTPDEISRYFNMHYRVKAVVEPLLQKITLSGKIKNVEAAVGELKKIDMNISPYFTGSSFVSSPQATGTHSSATTNSTYGQSSPTKMDFFGEEAEQVIHFCETEWKAAESAGILKAQLIHDAPICFRLISTTQFENLFTKTCKKCQDTISSLHTTYVHSIPPDMADTARYLTEQILKENFPKVLAIFKPVYSEIKLFSKDVNKLSEWQTKLKKQLKVPTASTSSTNQHSLVQNSVYDSHNYGQGAHDKTQTHAMSSSSFRSSMHSRSSFRSTFYTSEGLTVKLYCCSITEAKVDVIINAANEQLQHAGGVASAIAVAAGPGLDAECSTRLSTKGGFISVTDHVITSGHRIPCKRIIHAVGPRWSDYMKKRDCLRDLCKTVKKALSAVDNLCYRTVAMPAISSGIFGVPKELCAEMYVHSIMEFSKENRAIFLKEIHIVDITDSILKEIDTAYNKWRKDPNLIDPRFAHKTHPSLMKDSYGTGNQYDVEMVSDSSRHSSTKPVGSGSSSFLSIPPGFKMVEIPDSKIPGTGILVKNFQLGGLVEVKIYTGSIVKVSGIDAIVCSADRTLSGLGPLSEAIAAAGGYKYKQSFQEMSWKYGKHGSLKPSSVYSCKAGDINVNYVVHAVVDQLSRTDRHQLQLFKQMVIAVLEKTNKWNMKAIAMPLIGAGFIEKQQKDLDLCCRTLFEAICEFCHQKGQACVLQEIHLINRNMNVTDTLVQTVKSQATKPVQRAKSAVSSRHGANGSHSRHNWDKKASSFHALKRPASTSDNLRGAKPKYLDHRHSTGETFRDEEGMDFEDSDLTLAHTLQEKEITYATKKYPKGNLNIIGASFIDSSVPDDSDDAGDSDPDLRKALERSKLESTVQPNSDNKTHCDGCSSYVDYLEKLTCGHCFCNICFIPIESSGICVICENSAGPSASGDKHDSSADKDCVICMDTVQNGKKLDCGHEFCSDCIANSFKHKPACPTCGTIFGTVYGNQPENGTMKVHKEGFPSLPGYDGSGTIVIKYFFPDGVQRENHPNPGVRYKGTERTAYLPDNRKGREVLKLLQVAWDRRLIFTIGSSRTTGEENIVTWNDIHHKTKRFPGAQFGFPDPGYFDRVKDELAAKGVTG